MLFQKISQKVVIFAALVWAVLAVFHLWPLRYLYLSFGAIVLYVGIQNMITLNIGSRTGQIPPKVAHLQERYGAKNGLIFYALFSVLMFILFGLLIMLSALFIAA